MASRSKRQKTLNYDGEDIISNLPDVILSHILSFLPTIEAARTSLLSKRWRYLWTCITRLEFCDESQYKHDAPETEKQKFLELVNRILQQQILTLSIHSLTLCFSNSESRYPSEDLNALICCVLKQKVQKFSIKRPSLERASFFKRLSVFPYSVFNIRSLIELDIGVPTSLRFPSSNCLANLRVLRLADIDVFVDCFSRSKQLKLSFPLLKEFEIAYFNFFDVNVLIIDAPMLESFKLTSLIFYEGLENKWSAVSGTIKLFASDLRKFWYYGDVWVGIFLSNPLTVVDVFLNVLTADIYEEEQRCVKAFMLFKEFNESVKFLELGPFMIRALEILAKLKYDLLSRLPIFKRLVSLVLAWKSYSLCGALLKLLQKSPNLQRLEFISDSSIFGTTLLSSEDVLRCIHGNLKVVKIVVSKWDEDKFRFTKGMLENAQVLNRFTVSLVNGVGNAKKELLSIPKASSAVQIKVKRLTLKERDELFFRFNCCLF